MIRRVFLAALAAAALMACSAPQTDYDATYYLVRHAEKTTEKNDPSLTADGEQRAQDLAKRLSKINLTAIYSSDYIRTRDTAAPIAKRQGLDVIIYDPRDLEGFAKNLLAQKGHILIVGHSNTTPQLSGLLGGAAGDPIVEATEYDRLYILQKTGNKVNSRIERYGTKT